MKDLTIYIPSRSRPNVRTMQIIPRELLKRTRIVVRPDEEKLYAAAGYKNLIILPKKIEGLSPTRQWILENSETRYQIQLDDDFSSLAYKPNLKVFGGLRKASEKELLECFLLMREWLSAYAHCGISDRVGSARSQDEFKENTLLMQFLCYDTKVVLKSKSRFDRFTLAQDKDMTLQLLTKGYKNIVSRRFSYNCAATGAKGGCDIYRTEKMRTEQMNLFAEEYPGIVKVVQKPVKANGEVIMRTKKIVYWNKAYRGPK